MKQHSGLWWFFVFPIVDKINEIKEYGFKLYLFRRFVKSWPSDKIIRKFVNKEFKIIGEKTPKGYKDWYEYLVKTKNQDWLNTYKFSTYEQENELKMWFYKVMKLHNNSYWFPGDSYVYRSWAWISLQYGFSFNFKPDFDKATSINDLPHKEALWYKILAKFFDMNEDF